MLRTLLSALFFALLAAAALSPQTARADISIADGPAKDQAILQTWYQSHIPVPYKATTTLTIHELEPTAMIAYLTGNDGSGSSHDTGSGLSPQDAANVDGVYDGNPSRIAVELDEDGNFDTMTFAHEYGHYVWFNMMSKDDRKVFTDIYNQDKASNHLVTDYAGEDVQEGFAEAFSFYVTVGPILNHRDPNEYAFLASWKGKNG